MHLGWALDRYPNRNLVPGPHHDWIEHPCLGGSSLCRPQQVRQHNQRG